MITDFHAHTLYCDGKHSPRDMIRAAIGQGFTALGLVVHAHTPFDTSYCASPDGMQAFIRDMQALRLEFQNEIDLYIGCELDAMAMPTEEALETDGFEYYILSAHYVKKDGVYYDVDTSPEKTRKAVMTAFAGDPDAYAEAYFETVASLASFLVKKPAIIGHFDLLTKFTDKDPLIDTTSRRYQEAARKAADALRSLGLPFEINTGAISRGWRQKPYPADDMIAYLAEGGAAFILSSDAHTKETLGYRFQDAKAYAEESGGENFVYFPQIRS